MKSKLVFAFLAYLFFGSAYSQDQPKADSLVNILEGSASDDFKLLQLLNQISIYSSSPVDKLKYAERLYFQAQALDSKEYQIHALQNKAIAYRLLGNLNTSFEYLFQSVELALNNEKYKNLLAESYAEISTCYTLSGDSKKALEYGDKSIAILRQSDPGITLGIAVLNAGYDHYLMGNYVIADQYYSEAKQVFSTHNLPIGDAYVLGNKALIKWKLGSASEAKADLNQAIDQLHVLSDLYAIADYNIQLARIELQEASFDESKIYIRKAIDIAEKEGFKEQLRDGYQLLAEICELEEDFENCYQYQNLYHAYKDSIYNQETADLLASLNSEFELAQKEAEVVLLLEQERYNRSIIIAGSILLIAMIIIIVIIYLYFRAKSELSKQLQLQKDELQLLNDSKDKFFSIISHDLRGPVSVIKGMTGVMKSDLDRFEADELKNMIKMTSDSAGQLSELLDNLLHWALQQRGKLPYEPTEIALKPLLTDTLELFQEMARAKNIKLELSTTQDCSVFVDKNAMSTILRNLINNAIKFSKEGQKVEIKASGYDNHTCNIEVTDHGIGIPADKIESLLNNPNNMSSTGTNGEKGIGLGLQLVKEFVALNKGSMSINSKEGVGTSVILTFPVKA